MAEKKHQPIGSNNTGKPKLPVKNDSRFDFQTPPEALLPLYQYLPKHWKIWEPASGKGYLAKALRTNGYQVIESDILVGLDFLMYEPSEPYDCIITNPPFDLKDEFFHRVYSLGKPFAFLVPLTTFDSRKRQSLMRKHGVELILFDQRINFETPEMSKEMEDGGVEAKNHELSFDERLSAELDKKELPATPKEKKNGSYFMTAWFTNGLNLEKQLNFVSVQFNKHKNKLL